MSSDDENKSKLINNINHEGEIEKESKSIKCCSKFFRKIIPKKTEMLILQYFEIILSIQSFISLLSNQGFAIGYILKGWYSFYIVISINLLGGMQAAHTISNHIIYQHKLNESLSPCSKEKLKKYLLQLSVIFNAQPIYQTPLEFKLFKKIKNTDTLNYVTRANRIIFKIRKSFGFVSLTVSLLLQYFMYFRIIKYDILASKTNQFDNITFNKLGVLLLNINSCIWLIQGYFNQRRHSTLIRLEQSKEQKNAIKCDCLNLLFILILSASEIAQLLAISTTSTINQHFLPAQVVLIIIILGKWFIANIVNKQIMKIAEKKNEKKKNEKEEKKKKENKPSDYDCHAIYDYQNNYPRLPNNFINNTLQALSMAFSNAITFSGILLSTKKFKHKKEIDNKIKFIYFILLGIQPLINIIYFIVNYFVIDNKLKQYYSNKIFIGNGIIGAFSQICFNIVVVQRLIIQVNYNIDENEKNQKKLINELKNKLNNAIKKYFELNKTNEDEDKRIVEYIIDEDEEVEKKRNAEFFKNDQLKEVYKESKITQEQEQERYYALMEERRQDGDIDY